MGSPTSDGMPAVDMNAAPQAASAMPTGAMLAASSPDMPMGSMLSASPAQMASDGASTFGYQALGATEMPSGGMLDPAAGDMPSGAMPSGEGSPESWNMDLAQPYQSCGC
jgi:hypothetical protein